jgi:hypothetical protein
LVHTLIFGSSNCLCRHEGRRPKGARNLAIHRHGPWQA